VLSTILVLGTLQGASAANVEPCQAPRPDCAWPDWGWVVLLTEPADRTGPNTWRAGSRVRSLKTVFSRRIDCDALATKAKEVEPDKEPVCAWVPLKPPS
jgi:hypothetical protein